jgi:hypothetical protein
MQISFKDQYLGRSDMWRLTQTLVGTAVYQEKKVTFAGMRAQVRSRRRGRPGRRAGWPAARR